LYDAWRNVVVSLPAGESGGSPMMTFEHRFIVSAPITKVAAFHYDSKAFHQLVPPGLILRCHLQEPIANGSVTEFTMWMGPIPVYWRAVHSEVSETGFVDTQAAGPMKSWVHRHTFEHVTDRETAVVDHIEYEHFTGWRGIRSQVLFARIGLSVLFAWRRRATQRGVRSMDRDA
jgi:ligand-binding SRPBCC domain-containing protein